MSKGETIFIHLHLILAVQRKQRGDKRSTALPRPGSQKREVAVLVFGACVVSEQRERRKLWPQAGLVLLLC